MTEVEISGSQDLAFLPLKETFSKLWQDIEVGASLCVYHKGKKVVDLWGGYTDKQQTIAWQADTLVNVYSCAKGMASLAIAILHDEGKLEYEDLVTKYWPEFGAAGKQNITIAQLLSHQAGLCGVDEQLVVEDLYDSQAMMNRLAAQKPHWPPGTAAGYHAVTWGYFPLALVQRITGQSIASFIQDKVAQPLSADIYIGLPEHLHERASGLIGPNHARRTAVKVKQVDADSIADGKPPAPPTRQQHLLKLSMENPPITPFRDASSRAWRLAEIPASNGHASARGLAIMYAALAAKGNFNDVQIVGKASLNAALKLEVDSVDLITNSIIRRSRGFILNSDHCYGPNAASFGHAGAGGSMAFADPVAELSFAYVMNQMQPDGNQPSRASRLIESLYGCLR